MPIQTRRSINISPLRSGWGYLCWGEVLTFAGAGFSAWRPGPAGKSADPRAELGDAGVGGIAPPNPMGSGTRKGARYSPHPSLHPTGGTGGVQPGSR